MTTYEIWGQDSQIKGLRIVKFRVSGPVRIWIEDGREISKYHVIHLIENDWILLDKEIVS